MNKKFATLLIPLMVMPLMAFGYAHFSDAVYKKYKIHVGSVYLNVTGFHVDFTKMPDVNNDGVLMDDELNITIHEMNDCMWYVFIEANPITGGWVLNTTMNMTAGGKLPFELKWTVRWDGPFDDDPCYEKPFGDKLLFGNLDPLDDLPMPPWSFEMDVWKYNLTDGWTGPYTSTQTHYKPGDIIRVRQHIDFKQPDETIPGSMGPNGWQKTWQCKWIRLWVWFYAEDVYGCYSSWTWEDGVVTNPGDWIPCP